MLDEIPGLLTTGSRAASHLGSVLLSTDAAYLDHDTGRLHPDRPSRLGAVLEGARRSGAEGALIAVSPREATTGELERVHRRAYLLAVEEFCRVGGGPIDEDTRASSASWRAALLAAGAGLDAVERLRRGAADAAFVAVRPPGHHATSSRAMGFCLLNNTAICAASLADEGERVLIVDFDAHHGNGIQNAFYGDGRVVYVSMHEWPLFPGTGSLEETGEGDGRGATVNFPFPAGTTGDAYLAALDIVVAPLAAAFQPTWVIASAGFDAHRADPLASLGLSAGDFADITARILAMAPTGRCLFVLEGGYNLQALRDSAGACIAALAGHRWRPEAATFGGPGRSVVEAVRRLRTDIAF